MMGGPKPSFQALFVYNHKISDPYHFSGAESRITTLEAHRQILELARRHDREVWFDIHIATDGPGVSPSTQALPTYADALEKIAQGAKHKVVVFELIAGNPRQRRALANAQAIGLAIRDGRFPVVASANCLQPDGQNDNGWDQGLLFLDPSRVWLQPPGYVTRMSERTPQPFLTGRLCWAISGSNSRFSREIGHGNWESCGESGRVAGAVGPLPSVGNEHRTVLL